MNLNALILMIGSTGIFASRAFIPAFVASLFLRFGHHIPILQDSDMCQMAASSPSWFTSDFTLWVLGVLSLIEVIATKNQDLRDILIAFDKYIKASVALLVNLGVLDVADIKLADTITGGITQAGLGNAIVPLIAAGGVYFLATLRENILTFISDIDPDDSLYLQQMFSILEDCFGIFAPILLFILPPLFILFFTGAIFSFLYFINNHFQRKEEATKVDCTYCGTRIFPSSLSCFNCSKPIENPVSIGFFGLPNENNVAELEKHKLHLLEKKRCSQCASRLNSRDPKQSCGVCSQVAFEDAQVAEAYLARISSRFPKVLMISTVLSFIPVLGAIVGIVYYRLALISPFVRYTGLGKKLLLKWFLRIASFIILMFQWIPVVGGLCLPAIVSLNYYYYSRAFKQRLEGGSNQISAKLNQKRKPSK